MGCIDEQVGEAETQQIAEIRQADQIIKNAEAELTIAKQSFEEARERRKSGKAKFEKQANKTKRSNDFLNLLNSLNISRGRHFTRALYQHVLEEVQKWDQDLTLEQITQFLDGQGQRAQEAANNAHKENDPIKQAEELLKKDQEDTLTFSKEVNELADVENDAKKRLDDAKKSLKKAQKNLLKRIREKIGSEEIVGSQ